MSVEHHHLAGGGLNKVTFLFPGLCDSQISAPGGVKEGHVPAGPAGGD